jgi:hypothetical protein
LFWDLEIIPFVKVRAVIKNVYPVVYPVVDGFVPIDIELHPLSEGRQKFTVERR